MIPIRQGRKLETYAAVHGIPDAVGGRVIGTVCGKLVSSLL